MSDDEFDDDLGSEDEAALIEAATQVERQSAGSQIAWSSSGAFTGGATQSQSQRTFSGRSGQLNLYGERAETDGSDLSQPQGRQNYQYVADARAEKPTHHQLDPEATKTWIYPTNLPKRSYQYNIVSQALRNNLLVALPTGLGKTFIAATVMLNWYRWAPKSQIAFIAPTKPLISQQMDACYHIAGIPRSDTALVTGEVSPKLRQEYWEDRRVFFSTPQTMHNDISKGLCDPKKVVCLVVDEAHKTTGEHAYAKLVRTIRQWNPSFRILALTATPGATVEAVQNLIDTLGIAHVEIRSDESIDIAPYINQRTVDEVEIDLPPELEEVKDLYCKALEPFLKKLISGGAAYTSDPAALTPFGLMKQKREFVISDAGRTMSTASKGRYWSIMTTFTDLMRLSHALNILVTHGLRVFHAKFKNPVDSVNKDDTESIDRKTLEKIQREPAFRQMMERCSEILADFTYPSHPKMERMLAAMLQHFSEAEHEDTKRETRIIVFVSFRDAAEEITKYLARHAPLIKPHVFVGQSSKSATSAGMNQKTQMDVVAKFKSGEYNTLVATCIGEEGLDIGEVDMIICYDTSQSPIRLIQRMGRTGRKRAGHAMILLTEREARSYRKALDNGRVMQQKIEKGTDFTYKFDMSPRILPREVDPKPVEEFVEIPIENTQPEPPKRKRGGARKKPEKRFFMPEGVETGFTTAASLTKPRKKRKSLSPTPEPVEPPEPLAEEPEPASVLLTPAQTATFRRAYQSIDDSDQVIINPPDLSLHAARQRTLTRIGKVPHSTVTKRTVRTLSRMHNMTEERVQELKAAYDPAVLSSPVVPTSPIALVSSSGNSPSRKKRKSTGDFIASSEPELSPPPSKQRKQAVTKKASAKKSGPARKEPAKRKAAPKRVVLSSSEDEGGAELVERRGNKRPDGKENTRSERYQTGDSGSGSDSDVPSVKGLLSGFMRASGKQW